MHNRAYAIMTGLFVVILAAGVLATAFWISDAEPQRRPYVLETEQSVAGLEESSRVFFRGVPAGRVERIRFHREHPDRIVVEIGVAPEVPVTHGTFAVVQSQGLTGIANVQLDDSGESPKPLETDPADPARIPVEASLFDQLAQSGDQVMANLGRLSENLNDVLNEDNRRRIGNILADLEQTTSGLKELETRANRTMEEVPALAADARAMLGSVEKLTSELHGTGPEIKSLVAEMREVVGEGDRVGEALQRETLPQLNATLTRAEEASRNLERLARGLENHPERLMYGRDRSRLGPGEEEAR